MKETYIIENIQQDDSIAVRREQSTLPLPSSVNIPRPQLIVPATDFRLPVTDSIIYQPRTVVVRPKPVTVTLSGRDSVVLNLTGGDSLYTDWYLEAKHELFTRPEAYSEVLDSLFFAEESNEADASTSPITIVESPRNVVSIQPVNDIKSPEKGNLLHSEWFIAILVFLLIITGLVRMNWYRYLRTVMLTIFYPSFTTKLNHTNISNYTPSLILSSLFYLNISVFTFETLTVYDRPLIGLEGAVLIPILFLFFFLLFTGKVLAYRFVAYVFDTKKQVHQYLSASSAISKAYGVLLLPIMILLPFIESGYTDYLIKAGIGLYIALYMIQLSNGVRSNFSNLFSGYYIILYLCALEILPLAVLYKVLFG